MSSMPPLGLQLEKALWSQGFRLVAGVDEAGRGAWAGPVVAAAVVLPPHRRELVCALEGVQDSKRLTPAQREALFPLIRSEALAVGIGEASPAEVDARNVLEATRLAMRRALADLASQPDFLLLDHLTLPDWPGPQRGIPHGDSLVLSIAAASIVAKVHRDRLMVRLAQAYPGYDLEHNKGYGTPKHRLALARLGPSPIHRRSYRPVACLLEDGR
ncbi:MAG: ribonuclease HII [Anaerolineae bacterium]|nr:ribonuclease HII [Anaerolineae bacterium]